MACGATHILEIWTLWHLNYWLSGGLKVFTAIISCCAVIGLAHLVPSGRSSLTELVSDGEELREGVTDSQQVSPALSEQLPEGV